MPFNPEGLNEFYAWSTSGLTLPSPATSGFNRYLARSATPARGAALEGSRGLPSARGQPDAQRAAGGLPAAERRLLGAPAPAVPGRDGGVPPDWVSAPSWPVRATRGGRSGWGYVRSRGSTSISSGWTRGARLGPEARPCRPSGLPEAPAGGARARPEPGPPEPGLRW